MTAILPVLSYALLALAQQRPAIDLERAALVFGEAEEAALADDGELWGVSLVGPILFADPRTRGVAANQPDAEGRLREEQGVFVGVLPEEVSIANTGLDWAGVRWTMVMWPPPEERVARTLLVLHESFHRIQPRLAHGLGGPLALHLDSEAGRTWLRLELRALAEALTGPEERRRSALEDALVFRARRRALFHDALAAESGLERNEGLAEYTGLVLCGLDERGRAARAAQRLRGEDSATSFVRSFAYVTGPAYGLLLDAHGGEWRKGIDARTDLSELLASALAWRAPEELIAAAAERATLHGSAEVREDERRRAVERARMESANRARFVEGPVLTLPFGANMTYSFDPNDVTPLAGAGSLYGNARVVDEWGVLDASEDRALFVLAQDGALLAAQVPAPREPGTRPLTGEGWSLSLAEGWTLAPGARAGDWKVVRAP
ncbi:MAG: hypothetical protein HOP15_18320 [Planctomycetes bacterium]|nr:hypothetical protein [Planctomycetota bacterium]